MVDSLSGLLRLFVDHGADRIYAKKLAPNDNSKNQIYLGGGFGALNIIPHGEIYTDTRPMAGSKQDRPKAPVRFFWVDQNGKHQAPQAQLILYPDYPEVRMSGFLQGCKPAPSNLLTVRDEGRILFFGITNAGDVLGYAVGGDHPIATEINARQWQSVGVFIELPTAPDSKQSPRDILLSELRRVYQLNWISSQKLAKDGQKMPYAARNGGGYTLEAELGITPNGYSEPDFMGWEVKQYGVGNFTKFLPKTPVTLMTPEPTGGIYKDMGPAEFLRRYGYPDKSGKPDRINFGGVYTCTKDHHADTGLRISIDGYDAARGTITNLEGGIQLLSRLNEVAAAWSFKGMMEHWNRKHAQAAYVPSLFRTPPPEYSYGPRILLCEQTDFLLFLKAFAADVVSYDPAIKIENASSPRPEIKRRSQFRIKHSEITQMYHRSEIVQL
ncbi:MvaI/BcnI family restriction endonuclease [Devosia sp. MC1541]|uniref:MvaI/BcnI family restriction endonuclease n=1 Tax=Devosia sp. MC1541 TaxID=2725264 RepID=UPI00145F741D|nr:MvaI/BcnI family restriction endonuclease [Devosia sp. MC1541]